jgi:hypothetical protein
MSARKPLADRFWMKVDKNGPVPPHCPDLGQCWTWTAAKIKSGYGRIGVGPIAEPAHRVSWMLHVGPIPPKHDVCHHCDNPSCVNPAHLFVGTRQQNVDDMMRKGRYSAAARGRKWHRGHDHPMAKLTEQQAREIKRSKGLRTAVELSAQYGVNKHHVQAIWRDDAWRHV